MTQTQTDTSPATLSRRTSAPAGPAPRPPGAATPGAAPGNVPANPPPAHRGPTADDDLLTLLVALTQLSQLPDEQAGWQEVATRLTAAAVAAVPAAQGCSLVLGDPLEPERVSADSRPAQRLDRLQQDSGEGPGVDALRHRLPVLVGDLRTDSRWPRLASRVRSQRAASAGAVLAVPLTVGAEPNGTLNGEVVGVLTLSSEAVHAFTAPGVLDRALTVATVAATVVAAAQRVEHLRATADQLRTAMSSRATIEQAKGLVAGWLRCEVEEAFTVLADVSQDRNVKLRDLAALVVATPGATDLRGLLAAQHVRTRARRRSTVR